MKTSFLNISITGIASSLPSSELNVLSLGEKFGLNEVKRIMESTGIKSVRVAREEMKISDLFLAASINLLEKLNISASSIDAIVVVSQTNDAVMPATSVMLQHKLGLKKNAVAFDISYGCSGYIYGLYQASMLISSGGCNRVLLCAGDVITPLLRPDDRHVRMVFGDAGSATLVEKGSGKIAFSLKTDGSGMDHLKTEKISRTDIKTSGYLYMNGAEIMEFALREVPPIIEELLIMKKWHKDKVGTFALHQANYFMLNYLRKKMQLTREAVPIAVDKTGNTGSASIPVTLSLMHNQLRDKQRLNKVVMCGFGVGLSWASTGMDLSSTVILSPVDI